MNRGVLTQHLINDGMLAEFEGLERFLQASWSSTLMDGLPYRYDHVGDLWWSVYTGKQFDPNAGVRVWKNSEGAIAGYAAFKGALVDVQIGPAYREDAALMDEMLAWGAEKIAQTEDTLWTWGFENDPATIDHLLANGFERDPDGFYMNHHERSLHDPLPDFPVREGWVIRNVFLEHEMAERVDVHRDAFEPSRLTLEIYRKARTAPRYNPSLDLVVVTPQNAFAAFCICWLDPLNKVGEFEPVGVRKIHQGKGLGKQVMAEGLRRLKARGAETAVVYSAGNNPAATRLYESMGMAVVDRAWLFGKKV